MNIPKDNFEIIVIGGQHPAISTTRISDDSRLFQKQVIAHQQKEELPSMQWIPFDETKTVTGWLTRKKNIIAQKAKFNNLVLLHDYIVFDRDWYNAMINFGDDWDVCMNCMINADGTRYRDWVTWNPIYFVDYADTSKTKEMYVSGGYFCVKKSFMLEHPLDEKLYQYGAPNQMHGEDVEWSMSVRNIWKYRCNSQAKVRLLTQHNLAVMLPNGGYAKPPKV